MSAVAWIVIIVTIAVALIILAGAAWFAVDSDKRVRRFARSNDLIPGQPSRAPDDWTTSTSREARMHRRIRYAIADVHQNPWIANDAGLVAERDRLDAAVFDLDDKLIHVSTLPEEERDSDLEASDAAIVELEELPKKLWETPAEQQRSDIDAAISTIGRA